MRQLFERNYTHIGNFIHVANHNDSLFGNRDLKDPVGASASFESLHNALALIFFAAPGIFILGCLFCSHDDVGDFWEPLCESFSVVLKKEFLWTANVIDFRLDQNKSVNITIEKFKAELENIELVVEHEPIYEHL
jgi:hypothetical protein